MFEDIKIIDEAPFCSDSIAVLQQTLFNIETGETISLFSILEKKISGSEVVYYANSNNSERRDISCTGKDCGDGCKLNAEKNGCTPCEFEKGTCTSADNPSNSGKITWMDVIGWSLAILKIIIDALKN